MIKAVEKSKRKDDEEDITWNEEVYIPMNELVKSNLYKWSKQYSTNDVLKELWRDESIWTSKEENTTSNNHLSFNIWNIVKYL